MRVSEILAIKGTVLFTIASHKKLAEAVATMAQHDVGSLVCFEDGRMVGILTFREVLTTLHARGAAWAAERVADVMVCDPVVGEPGMEVDDLRHLMLETHMRYLPIMDGATLLGVISFHDVARAMLEEQGFENRMLRAYISDWAQTERPA